MKRLLFLTGLLILALILSSFYSSDPEITITIIYDNYEYEDGFKNSWGFSCLIEGTDQTILFDTGNKDGILMHNFKAAGKDPEEVDLIVLSHIHGDHTGGITEFLEYKTGIDVYIPESFPENFKKDLINHGAHPVMVETARKITNNVWSTGEMGSGIIEQSLVIQTPKGLVIITGCAHPGIEKIVEKALEIKDEEILLVMGGFHLLQTDTDAVKVIARKFKDQNILYAAPTHCSGDDTKRIFKEIFGDHFLDLGTGKVVNTVGL